MKLRKSTEIIQNQDNKITNKQKIYLLLMGAFFLSGFQLGFKVSDIYQGNTIPNQSEVQQGYIAPSKLEVECRDLDGNGERETIIKIDSTPYLLKEINGLPTLSMYKIKPAEVVPVK